MPPRKKKKKKNQDAPKWVKPTAGHIFVRKEFEPWRVSLIEEIKKLRGADGKIDSKILKKLGARLIGKVNDGDLSHLDTKLPFDEIKLLKENLNFICKSLQLNKVQIHLISDKSAPECEIKESAAPEAPVMFGYVE